MKEVSFFRRRKVLKEVNSLDLHPVRMIGSEKREEENINLLLPRFNNRLASKIFQPHWKEKFIKIKLDETIHQIEKLGKGMLVKESQVMALLLSYELIKELKNAK